MAQEERRKDSSLTDDMPTSSEMTREHIINRMWEEETKKFHTEINQPHGFSTLEEGADVIRDEFGDDNADFVEDFIDRLRTNFVPYQRKRAKEMVEIMKADAEKAKAQAQNRLIGELQR